MPDLLAVVAVVNVNFCKLQNQAVYGDLGKKTFISINPFYFI